MGNVLAKFRDINTFVFDVDGVLTDGSVVITENGDLLRNMLIKDGYALQLAVKLGYRILVITGGKSEGVVKRLEGLGIQDVYKNISDKATIFEAFIEKNTINREHCLYMGDDMPDIPVMKKVGLAACPKDACTDVLKIADFITKKDGGKGCVREVIEKTLKIQERWPSH